ncbi:uncharacterized protein [Argopecten irradians]|uniref:uncharacterized protein isoform X4 n=1 Tax=Argopecten irradians TaxID=31199 RepID=UPI003723CB59
MKFTLIVAFCLLAVAAGRSLKDNKRHHEARNHIERRVQQERGHVERKAPKIKVEKHQLAAKRTFDDYTTPYEYDGTTDGYAKKKSFDAKRTNDDYTTTFGGYDGTTDGYGKKKSLAAKRTYDDYTTTYGYDGTPDWPDWATDGYDGTTEGYFKKKSFDAQRTDDDIYRKRLFNLLRSFAKKH